MVPVTVRLFDRLVRVNWPRIFHPTPPSWKSAGACDWSIPATVARVLPSPSWTMQVSKSPFESPAGQVIAT